jgi:hypothetical protein
MGFASFSGPLRVGDVKEGATKNAGLAVLARSYTVPTANIVTAGSTQTMFYIPAGTKILGVSVEKTVAITTATEVAVVIGKVGGTTNFFVTTFNTGVSVGKVAAATVDGQLQVAATNNVGTTDVGLTVTTTATTGNAAAGSIVITVLYMQRLADGAENPVGS